MRQPVHDHMQRYNPTTKMFDIVKDGLVVASYGNPLTAQREMAELRQAAAREARPARIEVSGIKAVNRRGAS